MNKNNIIQINGHYYLEIDEIDAKYLSDKKCEINFRKQTIKVEKDTSHQIKSIDDYWSIAAKDSKREIFMNTIRPILKEKLGYEYSEIKCEEKAKLLCREYYISQDKGQKYGGPYLINE